MSDSGGGHGGGVNAGFLELLASQNQSNGASIETPSILDLANDVDVNMFNGDSIYNVINNNDNTAMDALEGIFSDIEDEGIRHVYFNPEDRKSALDFSRADPFEIVEQMKLLIGEYKSCRPLKSGSLLIEVDSHEKVLKLLKVNSFLSIKVVPKMAKDIGTTKGIVYEPRVVERTENQLCDYWKQFGVIQVDKNTTKDREGNVKFTGSYTLTFKCDKLPERVLIGDQWKPVKPWLRQVLQCKKCNKFNHFAKNCRGPEICHKCGNQHEGECQTAILKCPNCKQIGHSARDKKCSHYEREIEIVNIRNSHKVGFKKAQEIRENMNKNIPTGYTSIEGGKVTRHSGPIPGISSTSVGASWQVPRTDNRKDTNTSSNGLGKFIYKQGENRQVKKKHLTSLPHQLVGHPYLIHPALILLRCTVRVNRRGENTVMY